MFFQVSVSQCPFEVLFSIRFAKLILEGLLIMNLYQVDKQSTKFTIWKYCKGCVKNLDGNDPKFLPTTQGSCITTMHLLKQHCQ